MSKPGLDQDTWEEVRFTTVGGSAEKLVTR